MEKQCIPHEVISIPVFVCVTREKSVSVNFSGNELHKSIGKAMADYLETYGTPPENLNFCSSDYRELIDTPEWLELTKYCDPKYTIMGVPDRLLGLKVKLVPGDVSKVF